MTFATDNISLIRANTNSSAFDSGGINENTVNAYANLFYPYVQDNAGNAQIVSLTIDIFNQDELRDDTKDFVNKIFITHGHVRKWSFFTKSKQLISTGNLFSQMGKDVVGNLIDSYSLRNVCFVYIKTDVHKLFF